MTRVQTTEPPPPTRLTGVQWLICAVAALGFAFDIYELLMLPLIVRPALRELLVNPAPDVINFWVGMLFWVPAMAGGIFGLLGGYLTDRFGRRRVLLYSILLYAFSALGAGFATSVYILLILRCTTFIGVCVEFVAAVAWLAELFHHPKQRESVLGYTQAFSSVGGLLVTGAYYLAVTYGNSLPAIQGGHAAWRYTLISGVVPAIPLIIIRPFLPESPTWQEKKAAGTLKRPSFAELFRPAFRRTTLITALMFACSYGAAFGAIQQTPGIVPGLLQTQPAAQQGQSVPPQPQAPPGQARPVPPPGQAGPQPGADQARQQAVSRVQLYQEVGGLLGRFALAFLAVRIVARRKLLRIFQVPGLILIPLVFLFPATSSLELLKWGILLAGLLTVAQFSFWGNYLPRVYPTHLRGTGESFAANIGGRMIGTSAALLTTQLANLMPGGSPSRQLAYASAAVVFLVYAGGLIASFWLPEPKQAELPE